MLRLRSVEYESGRPSGAGRWIIVGQHAQSVAFGGDRARIARARMSACQPARVRACECASLRACVRVRVCGRVRASAGARARASGNAVDQPVVSKSGPFFFFPPFFGITAQGSPPRLPRLPRLPCLFGSVLVLPTRADGVRPEPAAFRLSTEAFRCRWPRSFPGVPPFV